MPPDCRHAAHTDNCPRHNRPLVRRRNVLLLEAASDGVSCRVPVKLPASRRLRTETPVGRHSPRSERKTGERRQGRRGQAPHSRACQPVVLSQVLHSQRFLSFLCSFLTQALLFLGMKRGAGTTKSKSVSPVPNSTRGTEQPSATSSPERHDSSDSGLLSTILSWHLPDQYAGLARLLILTTICVGAFAVRLFAVLRFESVIHEFDPWFNFRSTKYLVENGFHAFYNWFDDFTWYPLGRVIGSTVYPGLMSTSAFLFNVLHVLHLDVDIRDVCVFLAPLFASFTCIVAYLMTSEIHNRKSGLIAAALVGIVPGYISRSVAGSYDNECVSIFAMLFTFYMVVKSVRSGSIFWSVMASLAYFYMVNCWGGYIFITNLVPLYVVGMMVLGRFSHRLYISYSIFFVLGTVLAMQVRFVGFQAVQSSEHMLSYIVFGLVQAYALLGWLRSMMTAQQFAVFVKTSIFSVMGIGVVALVAATASGKIAPWTGRMYSLLDPTYAKSHIPIIASVSEHQPTTWGSFFFDLYLVTIFVPVGLYFIFRKFNDANVFLVTYCVTSVYFAGVMVRLMLVLAPAACMVAAVGISSLLDSYSEVVKTHFASQAAAAADADDTPAEPATTAARRTPAARAGSTFGLPWQVALAMIGALFFLLLRYHGHGLWVTSEAYSSPSIVLSARGPSGNRIIFDDFREAYFWLRKNTKPDAKVMSWWDYGYQITGMANRTVIVDNNTWNNSHIATVGKAMNSDEETAFRICKQLDVDFVLVIFGGLTGYASDDINKFLWMVRIGGSVDPTVKEPDYYSKGGHYTTGSDASETMLNSLMYKLSYYRFGEVMTDYNRPVGFDRARGYEIGRKDFKLKYFEEALTTEHWMVRIYRVKDLDPLR